MKKSFLIIITTTVLSFLACNEESTNGPESIDTPIDGTNFKIQINNRQEHSSLLLIYDDDEKDRYENFDTCNFEKKTDAVYNVTCDLKEIYGFSLYLVTYDTTESRRLIHTGVADRHYFSSDSINEDEIINLSFDVKPLNIDYQVNDSIQEHRGLISVTDTSYHTLSASLDYQAEGIDYFMFAYSKTRSLILDSNGYQQIQSFSSHSRYKFKFTNDSMTVAFGSGWGRDAEDILFASRKDFGNYERFGPEGYSDIQTGPTEFYSIAAYLNGNFVSLDSGRQYPIQNNPINVCDPYLNSNGDIKSIDLSVVDLVVDFDVTGLTIADNRCTGKYILNDSISLHLDFPVYTFSGGTE